MLTHSTFRSALQPPRELATACLVVQTDDSANDIDTGIDDFLSTPYSLHEKTQLRIYTVVEHEDGRFMNFCSDAFTTTAVYNLSPSPSPFFFPIPPPAQRCFNTVEGFAFLESICPHSSCQHLLIMRNPSRSISPRACRKLTTAFADEHDR